MIKQNYDDIKATWRRRYLFDPANWATGTTTYKGLNSDVISYADGPCRKANGEPLWKECVHTGILVSDVGQAGYRNTAIEKIIPWPGKQLHSAVSLCKNELALAVARIPSMGSTISAFNNELSGALTSVSMPLVDLAELFGMRKVLRGLLPKMQKLDRELWKTKLPRTASWREILRDPSGKDLAYKFGVLPMSDTINQIIWKDKVVNDHIQKIIDRNGKFLPYKFTLSGGKRESPVNTSSLYVDSAKVADVQMTAITHACTTLHCKTTIDYNTNDALRLGYYRDAMGISNPLSILWELASYSFIVDYVVGIGAVLDRLDTWYFHGQPLERIGKLQDLWSVSEARSEITFGYSSTNAAVSASSYLRAPTIRGCDFRRKPWSPESLKMFVDLPELNGLGQLSFNQKQTGLELLIQRVI